MKMKTAPVMMLDEMTIGGVGALMRFEHRRGMDTAVKAADFVGGFTQIFGNKFIKARKRFGLFAAFKFLKVAFFDEYLHWQLERARHADVTRPDDTDLVDYSHPFGVAGPNGRPDALGKGTVRSDVTVVCIVVHLLGFDDVAFDI